MRLFRVVVVAAVAAAGLSGAPPLLAENAGGVSGRVLDAGGHPLADLRVELVRAYRGQPVGVTLRAASTDGRGAWSFGGVPAGAYVVRMVRQQQATGVAVSVADASNVAGVLIVAPSLPRAASVLQGAAAGGGAAPSFLGELPAILLGVSSTVVVAAAVINGVAVLLDES